MFTEPHGTSLGALAEAAENRFGAASSLVFEGTTRTSAEIGALGRRFATGLTSVAVCMANCVEVLASYHATWRVGGAVTPLLFLLSVEELRFALSDSGAKVVVTTAEFEPKVRAAAAGLDVRVVVAGGSESTESLAEL